MKNIDKIALDRYLTTEPDSEFDSYCEQVIDRVNDEVYSKNEEWFNDGSGDCNTWLQAFHRWDTPYDEAAKHIEMIFKLSHNV